MTPNEVVFTVDGFAEWAHVSKLSVYRAVRSGKLRAARVNGRGDLRITLEWGRAWLEACATDEASTAA